MIKKLSYNEQIAICAQNENPFVENRAYNQNDIMHKVIIHLMDGFAPKPGDSEEADYVKRLYIATLQVLHESDMPISEQSIVKMRDTILARVKAEDAKTETSTSNATIELTPNSKADTAAKQKASEDAVKSRANYTNSIRFDLAGKTITVKKQWIQWAVIAILILLLIKIFK